MAVAQLLDFAGIVFVQGSYPDEETIQKATELQKKVNEAGYYPPILVSTWTFTEDKEKNDWLSKLDMILKQHDGTTPIEKWYHVILYCFNCGSSRIQDIDCDIILKCIETRSIVVVVFTKADYVNQEEIEKLIYTLKACLRERNIPESVMPIICSCNSSPKSRIPQFGKEDLFSSIQQAWKETVVMRLPASILRRLKKCIDEWKDMEIIKVNKNIHCFGEENNDTVEFLENDCEHFANKLFKSLYPQIARSELQKAAQFSDAIQTIFTVNEIPEMKIKLEKKKLSFMEGVGRFFASITAGIGIAIWAAVSKSKEQERFIHAINNFTDELKKECDKKEEEIFNDIKSILNISRIEFSFVNKQSNPRTTLIEEFLKIMGMIDEK